jgi:predicted PurR-regulated permease PerM
LSSVGTVIKRHWRLITFIICLLIFAVIVWKFISVLLPFIFGLIIAYLLLPLVRWLEKHLPGGKKHPGTKRISIILGVYFAALIIIAAALFYAFTTVSNSITSLWQTVPQTISSIVVWAQDFLVKIRLNVPSSMLAQYDQAISDAGVSAVNILRSGLGTGFSLVSSSVSLILGFLAMPLIVFFMLKDWDKLRDGFFGIMPDWAGEHAKKIMSIMERVLGRYIRGQFIMSVIIGVLVFILLTILKIPFAPALALWAALMENIPTLGVWLSMIASVSIALATNPGKALWVLLGLIVIQLMENNLLAPRIQGANMKMNPIFILLISLIGAYLIGIAGFIIAVPIAATLIELLKYFRDIARQKESE